MIIFDRNVSRLAMRTTHRSTLSDETKNLEKSHVGGQLMTQTFQLKLIFFSKTEGSRIPKNFYEMIFDPSEFNEPIFGTFREPLISEVIRAFLN